MKRLHYGKTLYDKKALCGRTLTPFKSLVIEDLKPCATCVKAYAARTSADENKGGDR